MLFFGSLFLLVLLLPRVSTVTAAYNGNNNVRIANNGSSCPGWGESTEMAPSKTIQSYTFGGSNQLLLNQWGWQDNGATADAYEYDFYQFGQTAETVGSGVGTGVGVQILAQHHDAYFGPTYTTSYYLGTAGGRAYTFLLTDGSGNAIGTQWIDYNPSGVTVLSQTYYWPSSYNGYSLKNPIQNFQNVFVSPAGTNTPTDFVSGAGQFIYSVGALSTPDNCRKKITAENSNMIYSSTVTCNGTQCTQNFNAPSGYANHDTPPGTSFTVQFGGGWGTDTPSGGVRQGDLLIAVEAIYSGGISFNTPRDTLGNTWTPDGGVGGPGYCSPNDCVEIWHAVASSSGSDTVTFYTQASSAYTYGFVREFVGYTGAVYNSNHGSGSTGSPSVPSFSTSSGDLIIAVAAGQAPGPGTWGPGQYYYLIGTNTGWFAATEYSPAWQQGSTTAPFTASIGAHNWAELAVAYSPP